MPSFIVIIISLTSLLVKRYSENLQSFVVILELTFKADVISGSLLYRQRIRCHSEESIYARRGNPLPLADGINHRGIATGHDARVSPLAMTHSPTIFQKPSGFPFTDIRYSLSVIC